MIKKMILRVFLLLCVSFAAVLQAESSNEKGYELLTPPLPTQDTSKVEVIEFFWYGCPHCYRLEPLLKKWLKNKPEYVQFIRQPAVFSKLWGKHAKAYFTAEALGVADKLHDDFFDVIQNKKSSLTSKEQLAKFFVAHGVDEAAFHEAYNSFLVDTKMRQAKTMASRYGVTGVPTIIINGKYKTSGPLAKSHENMIKVMDQLIEQEYTKLK